MIIGNLKSLLPGTSNYTIPEFLSNSNGQPAPAGRGGSVPIRVATDLGALSVRFTPQAA